MASLRQGPNLRKLICKSTLPKLTRRKFSARFSEHRDYAKSHKLEEPIIGLNFCQPSHSFHYIQGLAVEQIKSQDPFILKAREAWIIKKFDCYRNGLNKEP